MNYHRIYESLIHRAKIRHLPDDTYVEKHHVIPKCMGGSNLRSNLVLLTAKEHFFAHLCLVKMYGKSMCSSVILMTSKTPTHQRENKAPQWVINQMKGPLSLTTKNRMKVARSNSSKQLGKIVETPYGVFSSINEAARELKIDRGTVRYRIKNKIPNWKYKDNL